MAPAPVRLAAVVPHFIQYYAGLFRELSCRSEIDFRVIYLCERGLRPAYDPDFEKTFRWDIPLDQGYRWQSLSRGVNSAAIRPAMAFTRLGWHPAVDAFLFMTGYDSLAALSFMYGCMLRKIPVLYRGDTNLLQERRSRRWIKRFLLGPPARRNTWGCWVGQYARRYLLDLGVPEKRLTFTPHCVDSQAWRAAAGQLGNKKEALRMKLGLPANTPVILFCGKLIEVKRPLDLVRAAGELSWSQPLALLVAGSGPMMREIQAAAGQYPHLTVVFTGFVNQSSLAEVYAAADLVCLPSHSETWGLVVNEAMYFGCVPVVSDQVGCAPDLVNGVGKIYPAGQIPQLVQALQQALAFPPERQAAAVQRVEQFSTEKAADGIVEAAVRSQRR